MEPSHSPFGLIGTDSPRYGLEHKVYPARGELSDAHADVAGLSQAYSRTQKDARRTFPGDVRPQRRYPGKYVAPGVLQEHGGRGMKTVCHIINRYKKCSLSNLKYSWMTGHLPA